MFNDLADAIMELEERGYAVIDDHTLYIADMDGNAVDVSELDEEARVLWQYVEKNYVQS